MEKVKKILKILLTIILVIAVIKVASIVLSFTVMLTALLIKTAIIGGIGYILYKMFFKNNKKLDK